MDNGLQEYAEAAVFYGFVKNKKISMIAMNLTFSLKIEDPKIESVFAF